MVIDIERIIKDSFMMQESVCELSSDERKDILIRILTMYLKSKLTSADIK